MHSPQLSPRLEAAASRAVQVTGVVVLIGTTVLCGLLAVRTQPHLTVLRSAQRFRADWLLGGEGEEGPLARGARPGHRQAQGVAAQSGAPLWHKWLKDESKEALHGTWLGNALGLHPPGSAAGGADRFAPDACAAELGFPKVALLFLTRGNLHHARLWEAWFRGAQGLVPLAAVQARGCSPERLEAIRRACAPSDGARAQAGPVQLQHLISAYVHIDGNATAFKGFPAGSVFHGLDLPERVVVEWGGMALVDATKALLRAALRDPANQKFMLMSESGIPLYPAAALWQQLTWEGRSRVAACAAPDQQGVWETHFWRWVPEMQLEGGPAREQWRKSSQWVTLKRSHAELLTEDTLIDAAFKNHCFGEWIPERKWYRDCYPDEHYFPTALAMLGREAETDCLGLTMHIEWPAQPGPHPLTFGEEDVTAERLAGMRRTPAHCDAERAIRTASEQFLRLPELGPGTCDLPPPPPYGQHPYGTNPHGDDLFEDDPHKEPYSSPQGDALQAPAPEAAPPPGAPSLRGNRTGTPLDYDCPLAARKFPPAVADKLFSVMADCRSKLHVLVDERHCMAAT